MDTPGLEINVRGQYYCNVERGKAIKIFKNEIFHLPETMIIQTGYENYIQMIDGRRVKRARPKKQKVSTRVWMQHIIMRLCLPPRLKERFEDYSGVRTCVIENVKHVQSIPDRDFAPLDASKIKTMSLSELQRFIMSEGITVPLDSFVDIDDARQAVSDEYDNVKKQEDMSMAKHETVPVGESGGPGGMEPDKEVVGADGVKEEHFTDPSLQPKIPGAADDLLT